MKLAPRQLRPGRARPRHQCLKLGDDIDIYGPPTAWNASEHRSKTAPSITGHQMFTQRNCSDAPVDDGRLATISPAQQPVDFDRQFGSRMITNLGVALVEPGSLTVNLRVTTRGHGRRWPRRPVASAITPRVQASHTEWFEVSGVARHDSFVGSLGDGGGQRVVVGRMLGHPIGGQDAGRVQIERQCAAGEYG